MVFWWAVCALEHEEYVPQVSPNQKEVWNSLGASVPFCLSNIYSIIIRYLEWSEYELHYSFLSQTCIMKVKALLFKVFYLFLNYKVQINALVFKESSLVMIIYLFQVRLLWSQRDVTLSHFLVKSIFRFIRSCFSCAFG